MATKPQRETAVERHLLQQCRRFGFLCLKFVSPARTGVPDRIVVTPDAGTVFVEVKRPGGLLRRRQRVMHAKMRRFGAEIHVVDDEPSVDALIARLADERSGQRLNDSHDDETTRPGQQTAAASLTTTPSNP